RRQQVPDLHLHQLQKLRIVNLVRLVQVHHDVRHTHLTRQKNVLPRLRPRTVRRTHHQDRTVHLRRTRDHVLHIVRVPRTVHVRVMTLVALVLHVRRRNRDTTRLLLRRIVNLVVTAYLAPVPLRHHLRQRRRQRRLPVVHVPNRPHVHVRLRTLKLSFRHCASLVALSRRYVPVGRVRLEPTPGFEPGTSSLPRKCSTPELCGRSPDFDLPDWSG